MDSDQFYTSYGFRQSDEKVLEKFFASVKHDSIVVQHCGAMNSQPSNLVSTWGKWGGVTVGVFSWPQLTTTQDATEIGIREMFIISW